MSATKHKKRVPSTPEEKGFIQNAHSILSGAIKEPTQITVNSQYGTWLKDLLPVFLEDGEDGFWRSYEPLERDRPYLADWKQLIKNYQPEPGQEQKKDDKPAYHGTLLSEVTHSPVRWLWKPRLALKKIAILDGDPGLGKSLICASLSRAVTTGSDFPDGTPCRETGGVVIVMPEDGLDDTIQPRFARAGASLTKISSIGTVKSTDAEGREIERPFTIPHDLPLLEAELERVKARLLFIDPLMAILGGEKDTYKDNEVREMLFPLKSIVERHNVAGVFVRHLTKTRSSNPLMAGNGSVAFIGLARTGLMVVPDPDEDGQVVFAHIKSNISKLGDALTYKVCSDEENGDDRPYIHWTGVSTIKNSELLTPASKNIGGNRLAILKLLREHAEEEMTIPEISEALPEIELPNLKMTLKRMVQNGEISKTERGKYRAK